MAPRFERELMGSVLVTGGSGFLGSRLKLIKPDWIYASSKDCNLLDFRDTLRFFSLHRPSAVIHLAARVGGIKDNANNQAEYFFQNTVMNTNVIHASSVLNIPRVLSSLSTCAFPDTVSNYPFTEDDLFGGPPAKTNFSYGITKRALHAQTIAYREQYDLNYSSFCPSNLYGPGDNYDPDSSHFVASLIRKLSSAKNGDVIELWGTGAPLRQQLYIDDLCKIIPNLLDKHNSDKPLIVANNENLSIKEMAHIAKNSLDKDVTFSFNGKYEGQYRKDGSNNQLIQLIGDYDFTKFKDGVKNTYNWYLENR